MGKDYETYDGTYVRDYIHVMDVANVHETSLNYFKENKKIEIFNLGTGKGYSVLEILNKLRKDRSQINFDSESARQSIASVIVDEL